MESKPRIKFTLLEKMEFYDDREIRLFNSIYPKIEKEALGQYIEIFIKDMCRSNEVEDSGEPIVLSREALGVRKLMEVLHRESLHCDKEEIIEYLTSLGISPPVCDELASVVLARKVFEEIPKSIRLHPSIKSMHWMIDISYYQRTSGQNLEIDDKTRLKNALRIILLISLSDGRKHGMYLKCGKESWLRYKLRMASSSLSRVEARSLQNVIKDGEEE